MSAPRVSAHSEAARYVDSCGFCLRDGHTYVTCPYKLGTLHPEHLRLRELVEWYFEEKWVLHGIFQDKAVELGLLKKVPADDEFREDWDCNEMLVFAWSPLAPNPEED